MSVRVIQKPTNGVLYSLDQVPDIILATDEHISVWIAVFGDNAPFFNGGYQPDFSGMVRISFKGLYENWLKTEWPTQYDEPQYLFQFAFQVFVRSAFTDTTLELSFNVANSRLNREQAYADFVDSHFLTNQPAVKDTTIDAPEFLTYLAAKGTRSVVAKFYTSSGQAVETTVATGGGCRTVNVSPARLLKMVSTIQSLKGYYDVSLKQGNTVVATQRYVLRRTTGVEKYFCFVNALGGIDTIVASGDNTLAPEVTINTGRLGGQRVALDDTDDQIVWQQHLRFPSRLRNWVRELLTQKKEAAVCKPQSWPEQKIVIKEIDFSVNDRETLATASFSYMMASQDNDPYGTKSDETRSNLTLARDTRSASDETEEEEVNASVLRDYTYLVRGGSTVSFEALSETGRIHLEGSGPITVEVSVDGEIYTTVNLGATFDDGVDIVPFNLNAGDKVRLQATALTRVLVNYNVSDE